MAGASRCDSNSIFRSEKKCQGGRHARPVLQLYEQATSLLKQGIWVICADEKTSIQARQAEQAPRPAIQKHPVYQSPRYHRRGAVHLMAALSVAAGLVYGQWHKGKRL